MPDIAMVEIEVYKITGVGPAGGLIEKGRERVKAKPLTPVSTHFDLSPTGLYVHTETHYMSAV